MTTNDNLRFTIDTRQVETYLYNIGKEDQLGFAVSLAINRILNMIQLAVMEDMQAKIDFRRLAFNLRAIKINPQDRATKHKLLGIIHIDPIASNLLRLETGSDHIPINGRKYLPVPNPTVFGNKVITKDNPLQIGNLKLRDTPFGTKGDQGTFLIESGGKPFVIQRTKKAGSKGKGKKGTNKETGTRLLYSLVQRTTTPVKLNFRAIATKIVNQHFREELIKAVNRAISTAKKK